MKNFYPGQKHKYTFCLSLRKLNTNRKHKQRQRKRFLSGVTGIINNPNKINIRLEIKNNKSSPIGIKNSCLTTEIIVRQKKKPTGLILEFVLLGEGGSTKVLWTYFMLYAYISQLKRIMDFKSKHFFLLGY